MFVQARMIDDNGILKGRAYTYECGFENVEVGSKVVASFGKNENQLLQIVAVDCPEPEFDCKSVKEIVADDVLEGQMSLLGSMSENIPNETKGILEIVESVSITSLDKMAGLEKVKADKVIDEIKGILQPADKLVVTAENSKDVKSIISGTYSKAIKLFDEARKQPSREFKAKIDSYNKEMLKIIEYLTDEQSILKQKTNEFDERERESNVKIAEEEIQKQVETLHLEPLFAKMLVVKDEYKKLNTSKKSIVTDIQNQAMILSMKQSNYKTKLAMAKTIVEMQNETLTNKLSFEKYTDLILQNVLQMGSDSEITDKIMADADAIRAMERRVAEEKAAEIERQKEAEAQRRLAEERARIEAEKAKIEAEKAEMEAKKAVIEAPEANIETPKTDIETESAGGAFCPEEEPVFFVPNDEIFTARYEIKGTMPQFHSLVEYAKSLGMTMEKIG